jgi:transposase
MEQPHDWREWRRLRAWYLFQQGWTECEIADALGASKGAVSQWLTCARKGGHQALLSRVRGTHAKLTEEQKRLIPDFLWHGPEAYGFRGEVWTCPRVVEVLAREFGVVSYQACRAYGCFVG